MERIDVENKVKEILTAYLRLEEGEITPTSNIVDDLGADSLALVELGFKFSDEFSIPMLTPDQNLLVMDNLINHICKEMETVTV